MEKQAISTTTKRKSEFGTSGPLPSKISTTKITQTMPDTNSDNPGKDVHYPYQEETKDLRKTTKAKKKSKKAPHNNHEKLQWLRGEGPQTD